MIGDDVFMTIEAFLHRRNARMFGTGYVWVTEFALDLLHARMHTVTERYGLFRTDVRARRHVEQVKKDKDKQQTQGNRDDLHTVSRQGMDRFL
jgi:hypothetical protein